MGFFIAQGSSADCFRFLKRSVLVLLVVVMVVASGGSWAIASPTLANIPDKTLDLDRAAQSAERASDQIFEGLEETKEKIGKTEGRKEVIQKAREHASEKWQSLADKARDAQRNPNTELSPVEQKNLKRLSESQP